MKLRFFVVPMLDGEEEARELNKFLAINRILQVERHFVADGPHSAWALCVSYLDRGGRAASESGQARRVDYRASRETMFWHSWVGSSPLMTRRRVAKSGTAPGAKCRDCPRCRGVYRSEH